jgi:plasmid stabilization system protein ParE
MRYTVVWTPDAQDQLTTVWLQAADRRAVTQAAHRVDQLLQADPDTRGVDFYGDRLLVVPPLRVVFVVQSDTQTVEVRMVW